MKQNKFFVKTTASVLVLTFSYSQILMAADVRQMLLDAKTFFAEEDAQRPHGMAASDLQAAQTQQQAAVDQAQMLQDFQSTAFSLTTPNGDVLKYVGDMLSEIQRPDGTQLAHIITDAQGNIQSADLGLSDGSVQVYQNGQVTGYQTPDGSQAFYTSGEVTKVIDKNGVQTLYSYTKDAQGNATETVLDNSQYIAKYDQNKKIKEATRKSDNQKITYQNGMIQKIVNGDGSQVLFTSQVSGSDFLVTPQGQVAAPTSFTDANGNKYSFDAQGAVTKIDLTDGSKLESITWDANNKVNDATLTEADGTRHIYQAKVLTRSYDTASVVTNYTYNSANILAAKAGATWEYLTDGTPVRYTSLTGDVTTYLQSGAYKGFKDTEVLATGATYLYEYQGTGPSITAQRREVQASVYNSTVFDGNANILRAQNPALKFTANIPNDGTIDQSVAVNVTGNSKTLNINLSAGTGSTYTFGGVTSSLGVTLAKGTTYRVEVKWISTGVGIYVYSASGTIPATPTKSITDKAWDPKFKVTAVNSQITLETSSGYFNQNSEVREKNYSAIPGSPVYLFNFKQGTANYKNFFIKSVQWPAGNISRSFEFYWEAGTWNASQKETNWSTGVTTTINSSYAQALASGSEYVAELRIENGKANFYSYLKSAGRPAAPAISFTSYSIAASFETYTVNSFGKGTMLKNTTSQALQAVSSTPLTARRNLLTSGLFIKPAAPVSGGSTGATDLASIKYDASSNLKEVVLKDGKRLVFNQGVLQQAYDASGTVTTFNFTQSGLSNVIGTSIVQNNLTSTYAADGKLSSIKTGDLTVHYKSDQTIEFIEKADGTELWNLVFNAQGSLTDALIIAPDGEERVYAAGKLTSLHRPDQTDLFYANDKVAQMVTPEKLLYNFDYTNPSIIQATLAGTPSIDALTPIKMEYDTNFNLKKVTRQNQEILNYLNTDLVQIDAPSNAPRVFNYTKDAQGKVLSYTVTQGNILTYYDANNQPLRAVISPDANNPNTLDITYQYGKIRQIKKNTVLTFTYTYSFDAAGAELTVVEDLEENTQKTYKDTNLASTLDKVTNVLSSYEYTGAKVSKVTAARFGRLLHTYGYSYSGTSTIVLDEAGVIRTYDANQKLILLEKNGQKFGYTYSTQAVTTQNGPPVTTETVLPISLYQTSARSVLPWDGSTGWFSWEQQWGKDYLVTYWQDQWVQYTANMSVAGDLKISLESMNNGGAPAGYTNFQLDVSVDGVSKGVFATPADPLLWKTGNIVLQGLNAGSHAIKLKWVNIANDASGAHSNFMFRNVSFRQVVTTSSTTTQQVEVASENLMERKLTDGSIAYYLNGVMDHIGLPDGTVVAGVAAQPMDPNQSGTVVIDKTLSDGSVLEYMNGELTKRTTVNGEVTTYTYQKNTSGAVQTITLSTAGVKMVYSAADRKLISVQAGSETFTVTYNTDAQGVLTGYALTAPSGSYAFAPGNEISFYASYISKQRGTSVSEIVVPSSSPEITPSYYGTGLDGAQTISGAISLARDMNYTDLTISAGAVLYTNGYKVYVNGNFVNRGMISAKGGDGGNGASGSIAGTPLGGAAGVISYTAGTLRPGAAGVAGDIGRTWINSGVQGGSAGISVTPSLGGSGGVGGSGGGRADGQAGNGPSSGGSATDPQFVLTPALFNSTQFNTVYGGASGSAGAGGGAQASLGGKGGAGGGSGAGGGIVFISAKNLDNSQGAISADGGSGGRGGDGSGVEAGAGGGGAGGGGGAVILISNNIQKGNISTAGGQGGAHGTPSGGTAGSNGNPGQTGSVYLYRYESVQGQIKIATQVPYWDSALSTIYQTRAATIVEASDASVVTQNNYSVDGTLQTQKKADGSSMAFLGDRPATLMDRNGKILVEYVYDPSGNPMRVYLKNARDALTDEITKIRNDIETQRANTLRDLAGQNNLAYQSIQKQFQDVIQTLQGAIASEQAHYQLVLNTSYPTPPMGMISPKVYDLDNISKNIQTLQSQLSTVRQQEADAYANLGSQVGTVSAQIETDATRTMSELAVQQTTLQKEILRQEVAPVVYDFYRRILGRDPGAAEYDSWISQIDYNSGGTSAEVKTNGGVNLTTAISNYLNVLPELAERQAYVASIKQAVTTQINNYLAMTQAQKEAFAATLGLTPGDIVPVSSADAAKILNWVNTRSLHFGQSAFLALESLLDQKGKVYTRETLAQQAILIDVLSGVISPLDDGDLVISVYALNKTGKLYGVDLNGANISWDDLKVLMPSSATASTTRVIAHVNGNHFVIVTSMTDTTVTYIDPGIGKDKQNESRTISKADFLKAWKGNVVVEQVVLNQVPNNAQKVLSKDDQKNIRGSFFPLLAAVFVAIFSAVTAVVTAVVSAIAVLLSTIGAMVANIVGAIGGFLQGFGQALGQIGSSLFAGIKGAIGSILGALPSPVATAAGQTLTSHLTFATFGEAVFKTAITTGFSIATSKGLQALGVNSTIANLASAFVTGGITGGFKAGFTSQNFIQGGVKALALQGGQTVLQNAGIDTVLSQTLLTIAKPFIDGIQTGNIAGNTVNIIKDLPKNLSNYGLAKIGENLGLSPSIAFAATMPLAQTLSSGLSSANLTGRSIVQSIQNSLIQGAVTYGIEFTGQSSPVLGSLLSSDIVKSIELALGQNGLFNSVFNVLQKTILNVVNVVGGTAQSIFLGISNFAGEIQQKGLAAALESNLNGLFNRTTQEAILAKGGVQNMLNTTAKTSTTLQNGQSAQELKISSAASLYFDDTGNLVGKKEDGATQIGTYNKDSATGKVALQDGTVYATLLSGVTMTSTVHDGQSTSIRIDGPNAPLVTINPENQNTPIRIEGPSQINSSINIFGAVLSVVPLAVSFAMKEGVTYGAQIYEAAHQSQPSNNGAPILFALVNGIFNNQPDSTKSPDYINNYESDVTNTSNGQYVAGRDFMKSSIYQQLMMDFNPILNTVDNATKDIANLALEAVSPVLHFVSALKIMMDFDSRFNEVPGDMSRPIVAMGYSGGFLPLVKAIQTRGYNTDTLIGLGAATASVASVPFEEISKMIGHIVLGQISDVAGIFSKYLVNLKDISALGIKRVINVWGTNDILANFGIAGKRDSIGGIYTYNIEIAGASHFDYMRRSDETDPVKEVFNLKVSSFVAAVTAKADDDQKLLAFLQEKMGVPDSDGVWRYRP